MNIYNNIIKQIRREFVNNYNNTILKIRIESNENILKIGNQSWKGLKHIINFIKKNYDNITRNITILFSVKEERKNYGVILTLNQCLSQESERD